MNISIDQELVNSLKKTSGFQDISLVEFQEIHRLLTDKRTKVIVIGKDSYIVFAELLKIQFRIKNISNKDNFEFIDDSLLEFINADEKNFSYVAFIANEFLQGKGFFMKLGRFISTLTPLFLLNVLAYYYASASGIAEVLVALLTASSIFVAIFSLFTTSQDYLSRKKLSLFETGKLGYFFSVDSHITRTGVYSILILILTLLVASSMGDDSRGSLYSTDLQNILVVAGLSLSFTGVFIILRAIVEFYIKRPAKFILGDLKQESIDAYKNKVNRP